MGCLAGREAVHRFLPVIVGISTAWLAAAPPALAQSASTESVALTERADGLAGSRKLDEAALLYERAVSMDASNLRAYVGLSSIWLQQKKHQQAITLLDRAETQLGFRTALSAQRGIHQAALKRWPDAQRSLERVMAADPNAFEAALYLGDVYIRTANWDKAASAMERYFQRRPKSLARRDAQVRTRLAYALSEAGKQGDAEREANRVLKEQPNDPAATLVVATVYARTSRCGNALALFDRLAERASAASPPASLLFNRAYCLSDTGKHEAGLRALAEYEKAAPQDGKAAALRGRLEERLGRLDLAVAGYRKAIAAGVAVEVELGTLLARQGRHAETVGVLWPVVERGTANPEVLAVLTQSLLAERDAQRSLSVAEQLLRLRPDAARSLSLHGRALLLGERYADADTALTAALAKDPKDRGTARALRLALERLAQQSMSSGKLDEAHGRISRAHKADPTPMTAHNVALLALARGQAAEAISVLEPMVGKLEQPHSAQLILGRAHAATGNRKKALAALEVAGNGSAPAAMRIEAAMARAHLLRDNDPDVALDLLTGLSSKDIAKLPAPVADELKRQIALGQLTAGEARVAAGRHDAARKNLDAAIASGNLPAPLVVRARMLKALVLFGTGDVTAASAALAGIDDQAAKQALTAELGNEGVDYFLLYGSLRAIDGARVAELPKLHRIYKRLMTSPHSTALGELLRGAVNQLLYQSFIKRQTDVAAKLSQEVPARYRTSSFVHNAAVGMQRRLSGDELKELERFADELPEVHVNLAIDAEARGDHPKALRHLQQATAAKVNMPGLSEWYEWKEKFYGRR
jgi:tetratricopeptide (TPR) repeat protein